MTRRPIREAVRRPIRKLSKEATIARIDGVIDAVADRGPGTLIGLLYGLGLLMFGGMLLAMFALGWLLSAVTDSRG